MRMVQMLATAAFCAAAATGWARTMSVTSVGRDSVTLAFGQPDGTNYTLCVAYGNESGGDDKYKWTTFQRNVATIAADQTTFTYTLPSDLNSGMFYRFFLLQTENLPYARELAYIATTSTSGAYIDTGIIGKLGVKMETNFVWQDGGDTTILGARTGNNRFYGAYMYRYTPAGKPQILSWGYGLGTEFSYFEASGYGPNTNNTFHVFNELKTTVRKLVVNDKTVYSYTSKKGENDFNTGRSMYIFGCNKDGAPAMGMKAKLYDMKIWENDVLVRNYHPVALANGAGALYDEVTAAVFTNGGSTPFALGEFPDGETRSGIVHAMSPVLEVMSDEEARVLVASYWEGGVDGDLAKDANWRSINRGGEEVALAPTSTSVVHFSGTVNGCWAGESSTLGAAKIVCDDVYLAANCDWRALGAAPFEGHLNLNGWKLQLAGLTGTGAITDRPFAVAGYQALDHIDSNGNAYVKTGVIGASGVTVEVDVMSLEELSAYDCCVVGSRTGNMRFLPIWLVNGRICFGYDAFYGGNLSKPGYPNDGFDQYKRYVGYNRMYNGHQNTYMNGLLTCNETVSGDYNTNVEMYIFALNNGGTVQYSCLMRLYAARFWTEGGAQLARDFVPVKRTSDGALGLYDKVVGSFHAKQGTGSFTAGAAVAASGTAGELWVDVAEGVTNVNTSVLIGGSAKLVKSGKGVYRTTVLNQTYTGGTRVAGGIFDQGVNSANDSMPLGQNEVTVVFDKEAGVEWERGYYYTWETRPANTTFALSTSMQNRGFVLIEQPDGIFIKPRKFQILIR